MFQNLQHYICAILRHVRYFDSRVTAVTGNTYNDPDTQTPILSAVIAC